MKKIITGSTKIDASNWRECLEWCKKQQELLKKSKKD